ISGISMGSSTIVGQALGAEQINIAEETAKLSAKINIVMLSMLSSIAMLFPDKIMSLFTDVKSVIETGIPMIRIVIPSMILAGWAIGLGCVFTGSGHNTPYLLS